MNLPWHSCRYMETCVDCKQVASLAAQAAEKSNGRIDRVFHDDKGAAFEVFIGMPRWLETAMEFDELWNVLYGVPLSQANQHGWSVSVFGPGGCQYYGHP